MRTLKILFILTFAFTSIFSSCKPDENEDVIAPTIKTITLNGEVNPIEVTPGSEIKVVVAANDNRGLSQIRLDIHDAFDGHGHNKTAWEHLEVINVSGTSTTKQVTLNVPEDAAGGPYHLTAVAIDLAGNTSSAVERSITVTGQGVPVISVTSPDFTNGFTVTAGDTIVLQGMVTDDVDLEYVEIIVFQHGGGVGQEPIYEEDFLLPGTMDTQFNFSELITLGKPIVIPVTTLPGEYEIIIKAKDSEGNYAVTEAEFEVIQ